MVDLNPTGRCMFASHLQSRSNWLNIQIKFDPLHPKKQSSNMFCFLVGFWWVFMSLKTQKCCEKVRSPFSYFVISIFGTHEVTRLPWRLSKTKKTNKTNKIRAICRNWTNDLSLTKRMLYHSADMAHNNWRARSLHKCWECYVLIHSCPNKKTSTEKELPRRGSKSQPTV